MTMPSFARAEGLRLWSADDTEYLDLTSGGGTAVLGFNHPLLLEAAETALRAKSPSFVRGAPGLEHGLLLETLAERLGLDLARAHLASSSAEAVEGALKLAYAATRRAAVIHCDLSHHGSTLGALSVMGRERTRAAFPSIPGTEMVPFADAESAEKKLKTKKFAAFIVEPIQFEAGVRLAKASYFSDLAALCKKYGTLLVLDETATGMGRTGTLFALQSLGVIPDVVCVGSALASGLVPIAGYSTTAEWHRRAYGRHDENELALHAFTGGALACTIARRAIELVDEPLLRRVRLVGEHLASKLTQLQAHSGAITEVRARGLLSAIELAPPTKGLARLLTLAVPNLVARRLFAQWVVLRLREKGYVVDTPAFTETVVRIHPALPIQTEEIDRFVVALGETLEENDRFVKFVRDAGGRFLARQISS